MDGKDEWHPFGGRICLIAREKEVDLEDTGIGSVGNGPKTDQRDQEGPSCAGLEVHVSGGCCQTAGTEGKKTAGSGDVYGVPRSNFGCPGNGNDNMGSLIHLLSV